MQVNEQGSFRLLWGVVVGWGLSSGRLLRGCTFESVFKIYIYIYFMY